MRVAAGIVLLAVGALLLGGPMFGIIATLSGGDVFVRGGTGRVVFDLVVGCALVAAGVRRFRRPAVV
jgi:hypothetical protein